MQSLIPAAGFLTETWNTARLVIKITGILHRGYTRSLLAGLGIEQGPDSGLHLSESITQKVLTRKGVAKVT